MPTTVKITDDVDTVVQVLDHPGDAVVLAGSAISIFEPTSAPAANSAVAAIIESLLRLVEAQRPGLGGPRWCRDAAWILAKPPVDDHGRPQRQRAIMPFETLLDVVNGHTGRASDLVEALYGVAEPNEIHQHLARMLADGTPILTTNFDEAIEAAHGPPPDTYRFSPGENRSLRPGDLLLKLHGTVSDPSSLRHTLRAVNDRFDPDLGRHLRSLTERPLVVLGYAGADYDIVDVISTTGAPILWLDRPPSIPEAAEKIAHSREVRVVHGDLREVGRRLGGTAPAYDPPDDDAVQALIAHVVSSIDLRQVVETLNDVIGEARVGSHRTQDIEQRYRRHLVDHDPESSSTIAYLARRDHDARSGWRKIRCALRFRKLARLTGGHEADAYRSHAADALDSWLVGQGPVTRAMSYHTHRRAAESAPEGRAGWFLFRSARSLRSRGRWDEAGQLLDRAFAAELNTWEEAHCRRMMSLVDAYFGRDFRPGLERAQELFDFASQTRALADLHRTRATCELLTGDIDAARESLAVAIDQHRAARQRSGELQSVVLLRLLSVSPRLAAFLARRI